MRKRLGLGFLVLLGLAGVLWWFQDSSLKQTLPDGTLLTLSGVKVGSTNKFQHGTIVSKTVGRLAPTNGFRVGNWKLERPKVLTFTGPEGREILTARLKVESTSAAARILHPNFYRRYRVLVSGERGFTIVTDLSNFQRQPDGFFSYLSLWDYPRDSRTITVRLEERGSPQDRNWYPVASFAMRNPHRVQAATWKTVPPPTIDFGPDLKVELGEIVVRDGRPVPEDMWEKTSLLRLRFTSHGQIVTNFGCHESTVTDATGNWGRLAGRRSEANGWVTYTGFNPLDPVLPWRVKLDFALDSELPATNLFAFTVNWPMSGVLQTNLGSWPVSVSPANNSMLAVELTTKPEDTRLTFVSAKDDAGNNIDNRSGSWSQHSFWRSVQITGPTAVHVVVAIRRNYRAEITVQPRYEQAVPGK
ncbi:MAG TPA: hypothetical protein VMZ27_06915 [Candidatus Saccharimonadales bacterium]|nr:hypothetical protein [Candidatus Saccharimonadales bacterium]